MVNPAAKVCPSSCNPMMDMTDSVYSAVCSRGGELLVRIYLSNGSENLHIALDGEVPRDCDGDYSYDEED